LRAHETTRSRPQAQIESRFVARHQAAAEITRVSPNALPARTRSEQFQRTDRTAGNRGASAHDHFNFQLRAAFRRGVEIVLRELHVGSKTETEHPDAT